MKKWIFLILALYSLNIRGQEFIYTIFNTSINSEYAELGITYLEDNSVVFASSKKINEDLNFKKNRRRNNAQLYLDFYKGDITENGDISNERKFIKTTNNPLFESDITFSPDFSKIYFTWNNYFNTEKRKDSAKWKTLRIMKADIDKNYGISNIQELPFNSSKYSVRNPEMSKDGKQLFFVSDMPGGEGYFDIYVVAINDNGTFGKPKNLGSKINSGRDELFPYVDKDNTLYFSSYGHNGRGSFDVFQSEFKNGEYQKVKNLPPPINSRFDDFAFVFNSDTNSGYFTSNRKSGKGDVDIYAFNRSVEKLTIDFSVEFIDANTKLSLSDVNFKIISVINDLKLEPSTKFNYTLNKNETYKLAISKDNYEYQELELSTSKNSNKSINKIVSLVPIKVENEDFIIIRNQNMLNIPQFKFDLDSYEVTKGIAVELNKVVAILEENPDLKIEVKTHTDSRAPDDYNMDLTIQRANAIVNYIVIKGIDPMRVIGNGYGETALLNHCSNGIDCSNLEHEKNRRIEFIVVE